MLKVHFTPGDGMGWALDEDLRQIQVSLNGRVTACAAWDADVIHAPFWQNLEMVAPELLERAFVIAHADNPPFFYVKQPEFACGQRVVDLWIARSREAHEQFQALGLPVEHIPYTIDAETFFSISDKAALRREFGIPEGAYVIANFHRDTEGSDLRTPKLQKSPELLVTILRRLRDAGDSFHVLLAGPRRHWIRGQLRELGIPFTFVGEAGIEGDDFGINILTREKLNRLYNASDLYVVPSRWEGGPQSVMEAAASRCKVLSVPLGLARDILNSDSLFRSVGEAVNKIRGDIEARRLDRTLDGQFSRWQASHTTETMASGLREVYEYLPERVSKPARRVSRLRGMFLQGRHMLRRRMGRRKLAADVGWNHLPGRSERLDEIMNLLRDILVRNGVRVVGVGEANVEIIGWPLRSDSVAKKKFQWVVPKFPSELILPGATIIAPAVQDVLNLRAGGVSGPVVVGPVNSTSGESAAGPFVVPPGERGFSLEVWAALAGGRPVVYPQGLAYWEQVFHGGMAYEGEDFSEAFAAAQASECELRSLIRVPEFRDAEKFIRTLLSV